MRYAAGRARDAARRRDRYRRVAVREYPPAQGKRDRLPDPELAEFYGSLFESEARHHSTYVRFAKEFADEATVRDRLAELAAAEARIIAEGDPRPRMHS